MATNTNLCLLIHISLLFVGKCWGQTTETTATAIPQAGATVTAFRDEGKNGECPEPVVPQFGFSSVPSVLSSEPIVQTKYYTRPIIEDTGVPIQYANISSSDPATFSSEPVDKTSSELEFIFSEPLDVCTNCIIYSIEGNILGVREEVEISMSDPFKPDVKCKVSLSEIQAIVSKFQNILDGAVVSYSPPQTPSKDICEETLQKINELCGELSELLKKMKNTDKISPQEFAIMKNLYQEKIKKLNEQMEQVQLQVDQAAKGEVDKAQRMIDNVQKKYNDAIKRLEELVVKVQKQIIELTATHIKLGNIEEAKRKYNEIENKVDKLEKVIKGAYDLNAIDNIILFSNKLPSNKEKGLVCRYLGENMIKENHLESPMVLVVNSYTKEVVKYQGITVKTALEKIIDKLKDGVNNVLNSFGTRIIIKSDEQNFLDFARKRSGIFDKYIPEFVKVAFAYAKSQANFLGFTGIDSIEDGCKKIIDFAENLYSDDARRSSVCKALYSEMKSANAYRLSALLRIGYREFKTHRRNSGVFLDLPKDIQHIVSGDFIATEFNFWKKNRDGGIYVVTRPGANEFWNLWQFETNDGKTFYINSLRSLYVGSSFDTGKFFPNERRSFGWEMSEKMDSFLQWEIHDANWKEQRYYLYNKKFQEYMNICVNAGSRYFDDYIFQRDMGPPAVCTFRDKTRHTSWQFRV